jgi:hypothetical protein
MAGFISTICSMPNDFIASGNKSMIQLLMESGYKNYKKNIAKDEIQNFLETHPALIDSWEMYSLDKRCSSGWYLLHENGEWKVGYHKIGGKEHEQRFQSGFEACAVFILKELEQLAKNAS